MMSNTISKRIAVIAVAGVVYYFLYTNLVGIAAAIAAPRWFVPFMQEHQVLGLTLMSLVTTVPAAAISAAVVGYALARFLTGRYFLYGFLAVCVMVLLMTLMADYGHGFWGDLHKSFFPPYVFAVPMFVALWLFLPLAAVYFGRRNDHVGE